MSDEGREGGAGEGGAERRAPPLVRASLNFLPAMRACGGKHPVLYVVVCVGRAHGEWFMLGRAYWKMRTATEHRNCTRLRRRSTCKDCIRGRKTESLKRHAHLSLRHHYRLLPLAERMNERIIAEMKDQLIKPRFLSKYNYYHYLFQ